MVIMIIISPEISLQLTEKDEERGEGVQHTMRLNRVSNSGSEECLIFNGTSRRKTGTITSFVGLDGFISASD